MRKEFDFYGYNSPTSGKFKIGQDEYFYGEDFRNVKRYKEYKDVGFTMLLLQHENSYSGEDFETSACNLCMTEGFKAGLDKIIVSDTRIKELCKQVPLTGENSQFKTQKDLEDYLKFCVKPYINKQGFYGLQLEDEPEIQFVQSYGLVCRTLKKLFPKIYLQTNLLDIVEPKRISTALTNEFEAYEEYINNYTDATGQDSILFDEYPFRRNYIIGGYSLRNFQIVARVCKERDVEFRAVMQSFEWLNNGRIVHRRVNESDMYWQLNLAMGFGCKEYAFFTYFTKPNVKIENGIVSTDGVDGACFINRDGTRTKLYYYTKRIIGEMKKFAPVILEYKYENNFLFFEDGKTKADFMQTEFAEQNENCPINVKISKDVALVTQLKKGDKQMFMVENVSNVKDQFINEEKMKVEIDLKKDLQTVDYYFKGKRCVAKVKGGKFKVKLGCGEAIFVII